MKLYPPRPVSSILPRRLPRYSSKSYWAGQRKFNGTRNVTHVLPNGKIEFFTRHTESHKQWIPSRGRVGIEDQILSLNLESGVEYVFDSEVMHNKTDDPHYKNRIILFDVLTVGKYLINGPTYTERMQMLNDICGNPVDLEPKHGIALSVTENIWLAQSFSNDCIEDEYKRFLHLNEIEGIVLKNINSKIDNMGKKEYECSWCIRCRKPHKNYSF